MHLIKFGLIVTLGSCLISTSHAAAPVAVATVSPITNPDYKPVGVRVIAADNQTGQVILDASASTDPDGDPLTYAWSANGGSTFSTNVTFTHTFNVGLWGVTLRVSDGTATSIARVAVQVETPCQAIAKIRSDISAEPRMPARDEARLHAVLDSACDAFNEGRLRHGTQRLEHFQKIVQQRLGKTFPFFTEDLIESAQAIIDGVTN